MSHSKGPRQQLSDINVQHPSSQRDKGGKCRRERSRVKFQTTSVFSNVSPVCCACFPWPPHTHTQLFLLFPPASLYVRMLHYVALITKTQHVLPCCVPAWLPDCPTVAAATVAEVDHQAEWLNAAVIAATCNATVAFPPPCSGSGWHKS